MPRDAGGPATLRRVRLNRLLRRRLPDGVTVAPGARLERGVRFKLADGGRVVLEPGCRIGEGTRFDVTGGEVRVGASAVLGNRCVVVARERIDIGAGVRAGDFVMIDDSGRAYGDVERPVRLQALLSAPVRVGAGATLGARACVTAGVSVGEEAVLEAGSVAEQDIPPRTTFTGVGSAPAPGAGRPGAEPRRRPPPALS